MYVNCFEEKIENPSELAVKISDRHFGVGADGLIMINPSEKADFEMEMYNRTVPGRDVRKRDPLCREICL